MNKQAEGYQDPEVASKAGPNAICHTQFSPSITVASQNHFLLQAPCPPSCSPVPAVLQNSQEAEDRILSCMMAMLEQMMGKVQQRSNASCGGRFQGGHREKACHVCNDNKHTTMSHCRLERLCFACLAPSTVRSNSAVCLEPGHEYLL